jgi:aspartate 1-decarboxylase
MGGDMDGPYRKFLLAKIHGIRVTGANTEYEGSITIPQNILTISGLMPHEAIAVWNVTTGARFETYILEGEYGSLEFHVNGAAAHLAKVGDVLIAASFIFIPAAVAASHTPTVLFLNADNTIKETRSEQPARIP